MLTANQPEIQLGTMKKGQSKNFVFTIQNSGTQNIRINQITVGCGSCTKASTSTVIISPNQAGAINVVFTPDSTGMQNKNVSVDYSEGTAHMPPLILKFRATVNE